MKNKIKYLSLLLICTLLLSGFQPGLFIYASETTSVSEETSSPGEDAGDGTDSSVYEWAKGPSVSAKTAVVMDAATGTVLYSKKPDEAMYPASLTKILTALIAIEHCSLSEEVTFSDDAIYKTEGSSVGIKPGETISMKDCLYALMLESANEVAYAIGEHIAGTIDAFVTMMNDYAASLGCKNTHFSNPHGLHDENHYTSAYDLALISKAALSNSIFRTVTYAQTYQIGKTEMTDEIRYCNNHQQMRYAYRYPKYKYDYCIGGKTGYTDASGYTLASYAEKDGMELICIVMDAGSPYEEKNEYTDSIQLLDFGYENFALTSPSAKEDTTAYNQLSSFGKYNSLFDNGESPLSIEDGGMILLPKDASPEQVTQSLTTLDTPVESDGKTIVGTITYELGGRTIGSSNVLYNKTAAASSIPESVPDPSPSEFDPAAAEQKKGGIFRIIIAAAVLILLFTGGLFCYYQFVVKPRRRTLSSRAHYFERVSYRPQNRREFRKRSRRYK